MTEAERTEMAILKAKADNKQKLNSVKSEETRKIEGKDKVEGTDKVEEKTPNSVPDIKKYPYEVQLGNEKIVRYKPWTGKTKKKFRKIFQHLENPEDIDFVEVINVIIRDHIDKKDTYLSDHEQQYLTALLRKVSIDDKFEFEAECEHCKEQQHIKTSVTESVNFKMNNFPKENKKLNLKYVDIADNKYFTDTVQDIIESQNYDGLTTAADIEMALHIKFNDTNNPLEVLDKLDNMDLKSLDMLVKELDEYSANMTMKVEKVCPNCSKKSVFVAQEIPGLFENLLK